MKFGHIFIGINLLVDHQASATTGDMGKMAEIYKSERDPGVSTKLASDSRSMGQNLIHSHSHNPNGKSITPTSKPFGNIMALISEDDETCCCEIEPALAIAAGPIAAVFILGSIYYCSLCGMAKKSQDAAQAAGARA